MLGLCCLQRPHLFTLWSTGRSQPMGLCPGLAPELGGCLDTALHQTTPKYASICASPYDYYKAMSICCRYGIPCGTSTIARYVHRLIAGDFLGVQPEGKKIITRHIGNGGSLSAVKDGKWIPLWVLLLKVLMMGTRSGDIDACAVSYLMEKPTVLLKCLISLNKRAVCFGISEISSTCVKS